MTSPLIEARHLKKSFPTPSGELVVLKEVSFSISKGEFIAVVGESGTGKSTLLHVLGTLDRPSGGSVLFKGEDLFSAGDEQLARHRNTSIGFVFQFHHLLPEFSALENVAMPALIKGAGMGESVRKRAAELLDLMGLADRRDQRPAQLSGGEQQRVAVARALMNQPELVLADEPTGNLDVNTAARLHEELLRLSRMLEQTFVVATHNLSLASMADRVFLLADGHANEVAPSKLVGTQQAVTGERNRTNNN